MSGQGAQADRKADAPRRAGAPALLAVALALVALLGVNLFAHISLRQQRLDMTEEKLFTITEATRRVLARLDEPVTLTFYYSRALAERAAPYADHGARIQALLRQYAALAPGKLRVEVVDPQPFSKEEDLAIAAGLRPVPLPDGRNAWFGIVGENTTGKREVIAFLPVERAPLLEYDLTRLIHRLGQPKRPVVGVLTSLPVFGKTLPSGRRTAEWAIVAQLRELFEVRRIDPAGKPEQLNDVDMLLLATPVLAQEPMWRAVEKHLLSGMPAVLALDPLAEVAMTDMALIGETNLREKHTLVRMLRKWGVEVKTGVFAADATFARTVVFEMGGRQVQASFPAWLELDERAFAKRLSTLFNNVNTINMASAGVFEKVRGTKLDLTPVLRTSERSALMKIDLLTPPDPIKLQAAFKPQGRRLALAMKVSGTAQAFFGVEKKEREKAAKNVSQVTEETTKGADSAKKDSTPGESDSTNVADHPRSGTLNLLLVGDVDFLADRFWARLQNIGGGRKLVLPLAGNATFVLNALELLGGGEALSGLTGRMMKRRPFERVEALRQVAEQQYRARERTLQQQLKAAEKRLAGITARFEGGKLVISERDRERIAKVRKEILGLRRSLRDVQQALMRDIQRLEFRLKVINIVGVALLVAFIGLGVWFSRRMMARRARELMSREA